MAFLFPAGVPASRKYEWKEARGEEKAGRKVRRHTPVALPLVSQAGIRARKS